MTHPRTKSPGLLLCHAYDRTEQIHAIRTPYDEPVTICQFRVRRNLPYVPLDAWGAADMDWCPVCGKAVMCRLRRYTEQNKNAKIPVEAIPEIARRYREGESGRVLAAEFNVWPGTIPRVVKAWEERQ